MVEWFEDLVLGMRFKGGEKLVTREDIKRFAAEFDPQLYHLDEVAAEKTALQGLAASGSAYRRHRHAVDRRPAALRAAPATRDGVGRVALAAPLPPRRRAPCRR